MSGSTAWTDFMLAVLFITPAVCYFFTDHKHAGTSVEEANRRHIS